MKGIALVCLAIFSVVSSIPPRGEIVYSYNYANFSDMFTAGSVNDHFNVYKYEDIDTIFEEEYQGTNIGGAFLVAGTAYPQTRFIMENIFIVNMTASFYCGNTHSEDGENGLKIDVEYYYPSEGKDTTYLCQEKGWHYDYTWTPPSHFDHDKAVNIYIGAANVTINKAYGFDEYRIITTDIIPPQLLQRDNNASNKTETT